MNDEQAEAARMAETNKSGDSTAWLGTLSGARLDLIDPKPRQIIFSDIAAGLSKECRYSGQIRDFYSVAEHSIYVSQAAIHQGRRLGMDQNNLYILGQQALLHDATEAYIKDLPTPLKALLPEYKAVEKKLLEAIFDRFNVPYPMNSIVHDMDARIVSDEKPRLLFVDTWPHYQERFKPLSIKIECWEPRVAEANFFIAARGLGLID